MGLVNSVARLLFWEVGMPHWESLENLERRTNRLGHQSGHIS